jgi:hypothetical protein
MGKKSEKVPRTSAQGFQAKCKVKCPETVFLRKPNSLQPPFDDQPYPNGTWPLRFVCPRCSNGNTFQRIEFSPCPRPKREKVLWCLSIQCCEGDCKLGLQLHTTYAGVDPNSVTKQISTALGMFSCAANHKQPATWPFGMRARKPIPVY